MKQFYVSNSETSTRMFRSNFIEALSKVHFTVPLILFIPVILFCLYQAVIAPELSFISGLLFFVLGFIVWTVTEYFMHRFIFHYEPKSQFGKRMHFIFHGVHHDYPKDKLRLVLPPIVSIPLATAFYFLFSRCITGGEFYSFFAAFISGYLLYDMTHYAIHHFQLKGRLWNVLKTHHLKHHYVYPDKGYGVTSPLWDKIAQTEFEEDGKTNSSKSAYLKTTR